jgi:Arc/MetJ family transcription regulator
MTRPTVSTDRPAVVGRGGEDRLVREAEFGMRVVRADEVMLVIADEERSPAAGVSAWRWSGARSRPRARSAARQRVRRVSEVYGVSIIGCMLWGVVKRTNINLDMDLVHEAAHELGTQRTTDTVHQALREVIARARRARLAQRDFEDLTPDALEAMRRPAGSTS